MTPTIRLARTDEAAALAELAARTFRDAFGADNRPEDLARHLATAYGTVQQSAELADPDIITLVAADDGLLVAFAQLRRGQPPPCVRGVAPIELWRFYLAAAWHGRGFAQQLMNHVVEAAQNAGASALWLGVWERNPRAIAFYRKVGFVDVGQHVFIVGSDPQTDRIMTRPLVDKGPHNHAIVAAESFKELLRQAIEELPEDASMEDAMERLVFLARISGPRKRRSRVYDQS